jgi:GGDEF domain-containing protein
MPPRLDRALQVRTANRLRASLARDEISGRPVLNALADDVQRELRDVGGGRVAALVIHVGGLVDMVPYPLAGREVRTLVMREVARLVDEQVRRTDLLGSLGAAALLILAPGLDPMSGQSLAQRLRDLFVNRHFEVGDSQMQLRITVGFASRSATSPVGWTIQTLAEEAERNASDPPPLAVVA